MPLRSSKQFLYYHMECRNVLTLSVTAFIDHSTVVFGFQSEGGSANMFYTCGPNEAMVVSGEVMACIFKCTTPQCD